MTILIKDGNYSLNYKSAIFYKQAILAKFICFSAFKYIFWKNFHSYVHLLIFFESDACKTAFLQVSDGVLDPYKWCGMSLFHDNYEFTSCSNRLTLSYQTGMKDGSQMYYRGFRAYYEGMSFFCGSDILFAWNIFFLGPIFFFQAQQYFLQSIYFLIGLAKFFRSYSIEFSDERVLIAHKVYCNLKEVK